MTRNYRDRQLLDLAYEFDCMLRLPGICEGGRGEPCHSNQQWHGKGMGVKAHDCWFVPGCRACHRELDQGRLLSKDERREAWDRAFREFYPLLWKNQFVIVNPGLRRLRFEPTQDNYALAA